MTEYSKQQILICFLTMMEMVLCNVMVWVGLVFFPNERMYESEVIDNCRDKSGFSFALRRSARQLFSIFPCCTVTASRGSLGYFFFFWLLLSYFCTQALFWQSVLFVCGMSLGINLIQLSPSPAALVRCPHSPLTQQRLSNSGLGKMI